VKTLLLASALAASLAAPAAAQAPARWNPKAPENDQLLSTFNYASVESVLTAIGAKHQRAGSADKQPVILAQFSNGRRATIVLSACDGDGSRCKALTIQSYWTRIARSPTEKTRAAIDSFNQRFSFAKAFVGNDGRPALQRYLTADYGFVRGNLAVNLLVFATQAERFAIDVLRPLEAGGR
jgi:hypothetical protein